MNLYEVTTDCINEIESLLEIENLDEQTIKDTILTIQSSFNEKLNSVVKYIKNKESLCAAIRDEEKAMAERRRVIEKQIDRLKEYSKNCMRLMNIQSVEFPEFKVSVKNNPPAVEIFDPERFQKEYSEYCDFEMIAKINKNKIKEDLKNGAVLNGAELVSATRFEIK